ncbi:hypothetical protein ADICEAN_03189 [Cesiribacter andamanensis AMV16]|uniref:Uncharacterized protein n=1 Tax=Cesiribacter andamanensis AMV16 TaxID=1279009 RepID=M7NIS9_9BACT|nr:hypothetical protein ADICEAN_03189 [Cesiribacter andamanensis AMV16]
MQQVKNIAGAVAGGQNYTQPLNGVAGSGAYPYGLASFQQDIIYPGIEEHLAPMPQHRFPQGLHHAGQLVGANVGVGIYQNIGGGAMGHKDLQHAAHIAPLFAAGVELAIRIGARTPLAKAVVALGVYHLLFVDGGQVPAPFPHIPAPLQHNGFEAQLNEANSGKQTGRPGAYHQHWGCLLHIGQRIQLPLQQRGGCSRGEHLHLQVYPDLLPATGIDGAAQRAYLQPFGRGQASGLQYQGV